jgi:tripartite-type tricarboxylate transporter receptor subunit TctC
MKRAVLAVLFSCAAAAAAAGQTPDYPKKSVRVIAPFAPGGPTDTLARLVAQKLNESYGQPFIVDNRPAAGGVIGMEIAARAAPDGYTLLLGASGGLAINTSLYLKLPYDPVRDFMPITQLSLGPNLFVVHPSVPVKSVQELIALAKAQPNKLNVASAGTGNRLAAELFRVSAAIDIVNVSYKGTGQAVTDLVAGHVQMMFMNPLTALPQVKAGRLRALAVSTRNRSAIAPDLPTMIEAGLPGFEVTSWHGMLVPAGTPQPIVRELHQELVRILAAPDVRERLTASGIEPVGSTPQEFAAYIRAESVKYAKLIKELGIKPE